LAGKLNVTTRIDDNTTDGAVPAGLFQIHVTVNWTDKNKMARTMDFYTYRE
jgi:hypothetical protein